MHARTEAFESGRDCLNSHQGMRAIRCRCRLDFKSNNLIASGRSMTGERARPHLPRAGSDGPIREIHPSLRGHALPGGIVAGRDASVDSLKKAY